ncbi:WD domain-containing protein [Ophiocordyceps sinensis CO18]|uniref:WD domain-containing protein n=1 Tax=Ophiocordyceps sinensis (strain Co18 / CGMCC 3.14243) TaxID=911162 RepID=T5ADD8_OPHSC|nr:WD domain-containing protein [Ophiocordyceps sinensis CO18]
MAGPAPSSSLTRLADVWRRLSLRSDVDDIMLELLGRFSLDRIHLGAGDNEAHRKLLTTLLVQLNAIFYIQRLTLPSESLQAGRHLGFLLGWEVAARCAELVLQAVAQGRDGLWEDDWLGAEYLADFLLSALRLLSLHPRPPSPGDRRDRFACVHACLERLLDHHPRPRSFLLAVCREVTDRLRQDASSLGLPPRLRRELPTLASELYPLPSCLLPPYLVPPDDFSVDWLPQFLALRDVSQFVVGASIQYAVNRETRDVRLHSSSARARNALLNALDNLRIPRHLSRMDLLASLDASFRVLVPDTPHLSGWGSVEPTVELDALDALCRRLDQRQMVHRVSDREMMLSIAQVTSMVQLQDDPSGHCSAARPGLYVLNCPECHVVGGSQLRCCDVDVPSDPTEGSRISLPPQSTCMYCEERVTVAREGPLARRAWELLRPLETDADAVNVQRHLSTQFELGPLKLEAYGPFRGFGYTSTPDAGHGPWSDTKLHASHDHGPMSSDPAFSFEGQSRSDSPTLPASQLSTAVGGRLLPNISYLEPLRPQTSTHCWTRAFLGHSPGTKHQESNDLVQDSKGVGRPSQAGTEHSSMLSSPVPTHTPKSLASAPDKGKPSKWRLPFSSTKKAPLATSGDSSPMSSTMMEDQTLEEIPLGALYGPGQKAVGKCNAARCIHVHLSPDSTFALFWTQLMIQIWDVGTSPATMTRSISTAGNCILAAVTKRYLAYIIGTRNQKLVLRIVNLGQASVAAVEYRIASDPWCKSIAIDRQGNHVVVGFDNCIVRFFKTTHAEQPREHRLHSPCQHDCRGCPSVETLSLSNDGLALLASTRSPRSGVIQIYLWRVPFLTFEELNACRYPVPLHESEDNGVSSALFRSGQGDEESLICITTWTQSGVPVLVQPQDRHRSEIKTDASSRHGKLGSRIQCAAFSPSGRELAMVNDKGHLYLILDLNSSPLDIRRAATSRELTAKTGSLSMAFMTVSDEELTVLAWADPAKATAWIKKVSVAPRVHDGTAEPHHVVHVTSSQPLKLPELPGSLGPGAELSGDGIRPPAFPAELAATGRTVPLDNVNRVARQGGHQDHK